MSPARHFHRLAWVAVILAFGIIFLGNLACRGGLAWPNALQAIAYAEVHRHLTAILGLLVVGLALLVARRRPRGPSGWTDGATWLSMSLLMLVTFQALLGIWTMIWPIKPFIVMIHLASGLATFALLSALAWWTTPNSGRVHADAPRLRWLLWIGLMLLAVQIALDDWVAATRIVQRIGAVIVTAYFLFLGFRLAISPGFRTSGGVLLALLLLQLGLGMVNALMELPLWALTMQWMMAVVMLFVIVTLLARLRSLEV